MTLADQPLRLEVTVPILGAGPALDPYAAARRPVEAWTPPEPLGDGLEIRFSLTAAKDVLQRVRKRQYARLEWARLAWLERVCAPGGSTDLLAPQYLADQWRRVGVIPYPHQLETARRVVHEMAGRAILADEVGLGKTIEAGLILREYMLRGQVQRCLILCPAALVWQWYLELKEKFLIHAAIQRSEYDWERSDILIASLDTAKKAPHAAIIHSLSYDMLIVDEAHRLKNERTGNYRFVRDIRKTFCLMLTATPVQNDLRELYNLVNITCPGLLGSPAAFRTRYIADKRTPSDPQGLKDRLSQVIIRNRRGPHTVELTARHVQVVPCQLTPEEKDLYDTLQVLRPRTGGAPFLQAALTLITLQREACSSSYACLATLQRLRERSRHPELRGRLDMLIAKAQAVTRHAKADAALDLIEGIGDRVIVFTEYRATQELLLAKLHARGIPALGFDGGLSASRKEWVKELFRRHAQVLVSTESGGEGLNLQFCCHAVNYDLPWNPMKVEQRIGRIHRLGQTRDVHIYNLVTEGTVEEYVLYLLHEKIRLFELAVGELDVILGDTDPGPGNLESELVRILAEAATPEEIRRRLDALAARIEAARRDGVRTLSIDALMHE